VPDFRPIDALEPVAEEVVVDLRRVVGKPPALIDRKARVPYAEEKWPMVERAGLLDRVADIADETMDLYV
jgi:hypothetical protein